jgi:hypothetical protein
MPICVRVIPECFSSSHFQNTLHRHSVIEFGCLRKLKLQVAAFHFTTERNFNQSSIWVFFNFSMAADSGTAQPIKVILLGDSAVGKSK